MAVRDTQRSLHIEECTDSLGSADPSPQRTAAVHAGRLKCPKQTVLKLLSQAPKASPIHPDAVCIECALSLIQRVVDTVLSEVK